MPVYQPKLLTKITTTYGGSNYTFLNDQFLNGRITRVENGFDTATIYMNDADSINWLSKFDAASLIKIEMKNEFDASYFTVFDGIIRFISNVLGKNEVIELKCDGAGYGFADTVISHEYGNQSEIPAFDTMREIIVNAGGIVDGHVNHSFTDHATDTGHNYTADADGVEDIAGTITYLYFPFKPCSKALNDLMEIMQAIKGTSPGPHWIVTPNDELLVCTLGASHPNAAVNGWYKYYGNSQANATLTQGVDFTEFQFEKLTREANYVLYHGAFAYPGGRDSITDGATCDDLWDVAGGVNLNYGKGDSATAIVGTHSLSAWTGDGVGANWVEVRFPTGGGQNWNIENWGGRYNIPTFNFYIKRDSNTADQLDLFFYTTSTANYFYYRYVNPMRTADQWFRISVPVGPFAWSKLTDELEIYSVGAADWTNIDFFGIKAFSVADVQGTVYIDECHFAGYLLRGAKDATAYSATNPLKVKVITDDVAKSDSMDASTDWGTIAQLAKAELLRTRSQPIVGWVKTPIIFNALPGMTWKIRAKQKWNGNFNIDDDMRCVELIHDFGVTGDATTLKLTSDLVNSNTRASWMDMNKVRGSIRPEFQDRQATSLKAREIDATQTILEHAAYA